MGRTIQKACPLIRLVETPESVEVRIVGKWVGRGKKRVYQRDGKLPLGWCMILLPLYGLQIPIHTHWD